MHKKRLVVDHPLWKRLRSLNTTAAKRFNGGFDAAFGSLGLMLHSRLEHGGYDCTPTNTESFASTGGNGVHFSFLVQDGKVTESSPVVITVPTMIHGQGNFIGGSSLFDFLCLGYHRGYFALEQLGAEKCFAAYATSAWWPESNSDYSKGFVPSDNQREILNFLIENLGLSPWTDLRQKFEQLQSTYMPLLEIPDIDDY